MFSWLRNGETFQPGLNMSAVHVLRLGVYTVVSAVNGELYQIEPPVSVTANIPTDSVNDPVIHRPGFL